MKIKALLVICLLVATACSSIEPQEKTVNKKQEVKVTEKKEEKFSENKASKEEKVNAETFQYDGFQGKLVKSKKINKPILFGEMDDTKINGELKEAKIFEVKCDKNAAQFFNMATEHPSFKVKENEPFYMVELAFDSDNAEIRELINTFTLINIVSIKDKNDNDVETMIVLMANTGNDPSFFQNKPEDRKLRAVSNTKLENLENLKLISPHNLDTIAEIDFNK